MITGGGGRYDEVFRPQYHFSPARNWMNDPNGLVYLDGEYHLFFQYNPEGPTWGNMSWGHAVSTDLVHWQELPVAIAGSPAERIFSGSVVVDRDGFGQPGRPALVAVYTSWYESGSRHQAQSLAYSLDRGRTWTKYAGNPVLTAGPGQDPFEFRDPKVFRYEPGRRWVLVLALATEQRVALYSSPDLREWRHLSDFGPAGAAGGVWECPDLFELPVDDGPGTRWVLTVSLNPGAVAGGSGAQYFIGDFDGTTFTVRPGDDQGDEGAGPVVGDDRRDESAVAARWLDFGPDHYAPVTWNGLPGGRRVAIGWMSNWQYCGDVPTGPWRSVSSLPRELRLRTVGGRVVLVQQPVQEVDDLQPVAAFTTVDAHLREVEGLREVVGAAGAGGQSLRIELRLHLGTATEAGIRVRTGPGERTVIGYHVRRGELYLDRRQSGQTGFSPDFATVARAPLLLEGGVLRLRIYVDRSSVEVFGGDGQVVLTGLIFPDPASTGVELFARGGSASVPALLVHHVPSIW